MLRWITPLFLMSLACLSQAHPSEKYLVDVILFEHKILLEDSSERFLVPAILLPSSTSIPLALGDYAAQPDDYRNLPLSQSELRNTYHALSRTQDYSVLARYTWRQPGDNKYEVDLPPITQQQWQIKGRIALNPGRFPFLDTTLLISNDKLTISLRHAQAFKLKETYYLDHPIFGMLIRLTPIQDDSIPRIKGT